MCGEGEAGSATAAWLIRTDRLHRYSAGSQTLARMKFIKLTYNKLVSDDSETYKLGGREETILVNVDQIETVAPSSDGRCVVMLIGGRMIRPMATFDELAKLLNF